MTEEMPGTPPTQPPAERRGEGIDSGPGPAPWGQPPPGYPPPGYAPPGFPPPGYAPPGYPPGAYPPAPGYPAPLGYPPAPPPWPYRAQVPPGPAPGVVYAGFGPRAGAYLLDGLILGVPAVAVTLVVIWPQLRDVIDKAGRGEQVSNTAISIPAWLSVLFGVVGFLYFTGQWALWGRTVGMRATRLWVVRQVDGGPPTFNQALRRGVFFWGPSLLTFIPVVGQLASVVALVGMLLAFGDSRKQGWPDKFARTFVIRPYP